MQPTIYKWRNIESRKYQGQREICRNNENSDFNCNMAIIGGTHLTNGAFLPTSILKEVTATEEDYYKGAVNWEFVFSASQQDWNVEQQRLYDLTYRPMFLQFLGHKLTLINFYFEPYF